MAPGSRPTHACRRSVRRLRYGGCDHISRCPRAHRGGGSLRVDLSVWQPERAYSGRRTVIGRLCLNSRADPVGTPASLVSRAVSPTATGRAVPRVGLALHSGVLKEQQVPREGRWAGECYERYADCLWELRDGAGWRQVLPGVRCSHPSRRNAAQAGINWSVSPLDASSDSFSIQTTSQISHDCSSVVYGG